MLLLVGSNHRSAPVAVRERMSFPLQRLPEAHAQLMRIAGIDEGLILSTCNRVEILIGAGGDVQSNIHALHAFLAEQHKMSIAEIERYTYQLLDNDAIRHLFGVASGLDSMIMGEPQILGQVKQAYQSGKEHRSIGPVLDRLLQHCLATAKKVRTETGIARSAVSVAYAAVELARKIFGDLSRRSAMLFGAGEMGELVGRHLVSNGVQELIVCSRTYTNSVLRADALGGKAVHWEEGLEILRRVDILVSCTGSAHVVLTKADVARVLRGRRKGPLFVIDIAVPRDVDPQVNELDNVYLYDIDALQGVIESNLEERRAAAERAKRIIADEAASFERWMQTQEVTPLIVSLRESLFDVARHELDRFRARLGELDERQHGIVEELTRAIIQKILHRPIRHLRSSVDRGDTLQCATLFRDIFGVEVGPERSTIAESAQSEPSRLPVSGPRGIVNGGKKG